MKEVSQRQLRVGQEIKRIIAGLIERGEIRNLLEINAMVTVTEARVTPDLKLCNVYIITHPDDKIKEVLLGLQLAAGHIRKEIGKKTELRYIPSINFRVDETFAEVDRIERLLRDPKVQQDLN